MSQIDEFLQASRNVGAAPSFVQGGGGNCSIKLDKEVMKIKASGFRLDEMNNESDLAAIRYQQIAQTNCDSDEAYKNLLSSQSLNENRPSIETGFHAYLGPVVFHTHPMVTGAVLCARNWRELLQEALPTEESYFVDYFPPGRILTEKIKEQVSVVKVAKTQFVLLQSHGLIVSAPSIAEASRATIEYDRLIAAKHNLRDEVSFRYHDGELSISGESGLNLEELKKQLFLEVLCPDQAVFFTDTENVKITSPTSFQFLGSEKHCRAMAEMAVYYFFIREVHRQKNWSTSWLSEDQVSLLRGMESEKYRQKLMKGE